MLRLLHPKAATVAVVAAALVLGSSTPATAAETRTNLALGAEVTASSTHPHDDFALKGANLVDGSSSTRWAAADDAAFPLTVELAFAAEVTFAEVVLDEYTDSGTGPRVADYELQQWSDETDGWQTFSSSSGIGRSAVVNDFEPVTTERMRLSISSLRAGEIYTPTLTEIQLFAERTPASAPGGGTPAADDPYLAFHSSPAGSVAVDADARATSIAPLSSGTTTTLRAVVADGSVQLQQVAEDSGAVTQSLDLSEHLDAVRDATTTLDYDSASPYTQVVTVIGSRDGEPVAVRVRTPGAGTLGDADTTTIETLDAEAFAASAGFALDRLQLLRPFSTGMLAVYADGEGYSAVRLTYALAPQSGREPFALPFEDGERSFTLDAYGNLYASRVGGVDSVSLYDLGTVSSAEIAGMGIATAWIVDVYNALMMTDALGHLAIVDLEDGFALRDLVELDQPAASLAHVSYLDEIQVAAAGSSHISRFSASDGVERVALEAPGAVLAGSLRSEVAWNPATTFLAAVGEQTYAYRTQYVTSPKAWSTLSLSAAERGSGVDFGYGAAGTELSTGAAWFEYSLDGGASWAQRGSGWASAVADRGNVTMRPDALPAPQDGVAPYLRQETGEDVWASTTIGAFWASVVLPSEQYDALWRYRVENAYGSVASAATTIAIASEQEVDTSLRITTQPASVRVSVGESFVLSAAATAGQTPTVQWQRSIDGGDWVDVDGATSSELRLTASAAASGERYRAVFTSGASQVQSEAASIAVMAPGAPIAAAAPAGAVVVEDASFGLDLSQYSHDWMRDTASPHVALAETGFTFSDGAGWTDAGTGETQLSWQGTAIYRPYGGHLGLYMAFANPHLAVASDGRATLTAEVAWNDGGGNWSGPVESSYRRVIVATFAESELRVDDAGVLTFDGTPEWSGRAFAAGAGDVHESSFPASFVEYFTTGNRPWFVTTGNSRDPEKAPLAVSARGAVTDAAAATEGASIDPLDPLGDGRNPFTPSAPVIVAQPQAVTVGAGGTAVLTAAASGSPTPTVRWQRLVDGAWTDVEGATTARLEAAGLTEGEHAFRAVFTGGGASVESESAVVTVTAEAVEPSTGPRLTVSPAGAVDDGAQLAVSGSDYERGTNRNGAYLLFGYASELPSEGGRLGEDYDYVPGTANQRFIAWPDAGSAAAANAVFDDGGFSVDGLTAPAEFVGASGETVDCRAQDVTCGVFTIGAHGAADAAMEAFTPVAFTTDGGTDPGTEPGEEPGTDTGEEPGTDTGEEPGSIEPDEADLVAELEGRIGAPVSAVAGSTVLIAVGAERAGETVSAFLFSEPVALGEHVVSASGTIEVRLPDDVAGAHRLAVYGADAGLIGWSAIAIAPADVTASGGDEDGGDTASAGSASSGEQIARTGADLPIGALAIAGGMLLLGALLTARRRASAGR